MTRRATAFWILFAATLAVYLVIILWSLPRITAAAGGATPFDLRPFGYTFEEARAFMTALSPDGTWFYIKIQHRIDLLYPALFGATLLFAIAYLLPEAWRAWRWVLAVVIAVPVTLFDYLENHFIVGMLKIGPDAITPEAVANTNRWTVLKSISTTVAMVVVLLLLILWAGAKLRARSSASAT
jgi:hypothetical protein